jgi:hypothetical protein
MAGHSRVQSSTMVNIRITFPVLTQSLTRETGLAQPLWKNSDFEEIPDGKINLDDYDATDLTIRKIDQWRRQSGMPPLPATSAKPTLPGTLTDTPKKAEQEKETEKKEEQEIKTEPEKKP